MSEPTIPTPQTDALKATIKRTLPSPDAVYFMVMHLASQMEKNCHILMEQNKKQHEGKEALIQQIINYTDSSADAMEGADMDEFVRAETRMCAGIDILKLMGVKYDPMTGKREPL